MIGTKKYIINNKKNKMNKETSSSQDKKTQSIISINNSSVITKTIIPLQVIWKPKEDISTYELALCLPYLLRLAYIMPYEINISEIHMRHFEINDPNY